jgi:RND family efflux transporter MFP subunit
MTRHCLYTCLVAATVIGLVSAGCQQPSVEEAQTAQAVPVRVEPVKVAGLTGTVSATGTLAPALGADWTITAPEPARIAELPKSEGEPVAVGDLLVKFDIPTLGADLEAKRAAVTQAQVTVETSKAAVTRVSGLLSHGIAAQRELEDAKLQQATAEAALAQAQSAVTAAAALAARAEVHATFAGVVAKRWHNPGDMVDQAASDPIIRVINPKGLQIVAAVPVADLPRVDLGKSAKIVGPAGGDGDVAKVTTKPGQVEPGSPTADVRLTFVTPTRLPAGAVVQVTIMAEERPKAVAVAHAAIVRDGDDTYAMVVGPDNKAHKHPLKLGITAGDMVEVTSGLAPGDRAIIAGQDGLPDGATVTVTQ